MQTSRMLAFSFTTTAIVINYMVLLMIVIFGIKHYFYLSISFSSSNYVLEVHTGGGTV
jgi:hypothetical protein